MKISCGTASPGYFVLLALDDETKQILQTKYDLDNIIILQTDRTTIRIVFTLDIELLYVIDPHYDDVITTDIISDMTNNSEVIDTCSLLQRFLAASGASFGSPSTRTQLDETNSDTMTDTPPKQHGVDYFDDYASGSGSKPITSDGRYALLLLIVKTMLCVVGLVGNSMNVIVMTRQRMRSALCGRIGRAAHTGLVSLAVADMLCCATTLVVTVFGSSDRVFFHSADWFDVGVAAYGPYTQNAALRAGTWLTVVTAVGRYFAICQPLRTLDSAEPRTTRIAVAIAFTGSALMELPTAWTYRVERLECVPEVSSTNSSDPDAKSMVYYFLDHGRFGSDGRLRTASTVFGTVVGYLLPAVLLSFCTARLLAALRESVGIARCHRHEAKRQQNSKGTTGSSSSSLTTDNETGCADESARSRRLTVTLVAIVVFYMVLVSPSELLHIFYYAVRSEHYPSVYIAIDVANVLQTANFALNFILYCSFNSQFRATWKHLFCPWLVTADGAQSDGPRNARRQQDAGIPLGRLTTQGTRVTSDRCDARMTTTMVSEQSQDVRHHGCSE